MPAIYSAVTRTDLEGWPKGGMQPEEKLSVYEALCLFSKNIPYAVGGEVCTGTLEVGKFADMAVLDRDIFANSPGGDSAGAGAAHHACRERYMEMRRSIFRGRSIKDTT